MKSITNHKEAIDHYGKLESKLLDIALLSSILATILSIVMCLYYADINTTRSLWLLGGTIYWCIITLLVGSIADNQTRVIEQ